MGSNDIKRFWNERKEKKFQFFKVLKVTFTRESPMQLSIYPPTGIEVYNQYAIQHHPFNLY